MPVASLRSNQVASNDNMDSAKALIGMIDKKVRNLEKRKGKLDSYKQLAADGKELNDDQQAAIENLTSVELNLEFAKDLQKQFNQFALEQAKLQKKQAKKEEALRQANRRDADLAMIKNVLELQSVLNQLSDEAREDFINGTNGAVALGEAVLKQIDDLYKVITPDEESEVSIEDQITAASQHLAEFFAGSSKEFNDTTYKNLSEAIANITASGYFDQKEESEESDEAGEEQEEVQEEAQDVAEDVQDTPVDPVVEEVSQPTVEDIQHTEPEVSNGDTTTSVEAPPSAPVPQDDLTANEHGLNFLGESEVSSRSRIHADAPPFYPSSTHVTQPPQTSGFDPDFAPAESSSGWDEPTYEAPEPYRAPEENNPRGDRDGFRGGRGGRGGFRGRGGGGRGGNRGNYSGGNYGGSGNYGGGFSRGGGQNQRGGGGGFRSGNRGNRGNFRGNRGQRGGRGGYQQRDN